MTKEVMKQEQDDSVSYIKQVIEALYENSDPVSVEAAELLERMNAKQKQNEPIAWFREENGEKIYYETKAWDDCLALYATPQTKEWVGLTEKQIDDIYYKSNLNIDDQYNQMYEFVKAIELAHGIKE